MKQTIVKLDTKSVTVRKIPIGKYPELLIKLRELPKYLGEFEGLNKNELFEKLPEIVIKAFPDVLSLIGYATDVDDAELKELGLDEVVDLIAAVIEVNNFIGVWEKVKKITAHQNPTTPAPNTTEI